MGFSKRVRPNHPAIPFEYNDAATHEVYFRVGLQESDLNVQAFGIRDVSAIHTRKVFATTHRNGLIQPDGKPPVLAVGKHPNSRIAELLNQSKGVIG